MERKRLRTAFMFVVVLGLIISVVGKMAATGMGLGETAIMALDSAFLVFIMLFFVAIAVSEQDFSKDEQDQPEAESDSSLY